MVERIILFKLNAAEGRQALADQARRELAALPQVQSVFAGLPADAEAKRGWDLCLTLRFEHLEAADRAQRSDGYTNFMQAAERQSVVVKAWSFEG